MVRQALGHESLQTALIYVGLTRDVMDKELQTNGAEIIALVTVLQVTSDWLLFAPEESRQDSS